MDLFGICFLDGAPCAEVPGHLSGEIRIGSFRERFLSDATFWSRAFYERQWINAASRILVAERAAMIASIAEPSSSNYVRLWVLYRDGDVIAIQEQICFLDELGEAFEPERVDEYVMPRATISEEGQPISEWYTTTAAVSDFLRRRAEG